MMTPVTRTIARFYPPFVQRILQIVSAFAVIIFAVELWLILVRPELGLRLFWFATIPLAPMILLVAPNAWVSVCPISTVQTATHRLGRNPERRLSPKATQRLQMIGWALMLLGIPTRHIVFNIVGWATFLTALAITGIVFVAGLSFRSLSGWCVGACPIRPIEVLYGQFALDRNRPEKCTSCTACIASCLRLVPEKSHNELHRNSFIRNMALGFPGFVATYFALDLLNLCKTEHRFFAGAVPDLNLVSDTATVYGVMFGGFALSWLFFSWVKGRLWNPDKTFRAVALAAFSAYYLGVAPEICEAWGWPLGMTPLLWTPPLAAMVWVVWPSRRDIQSRAA